jgi:hypothetical protein
MEITSSVKPPNKNIDDVYLELIDHEDLPDIYHDIGRMMYDLIQYLREHVPGDPLEAWTSHLILVLSDRQNEKFVRARAWDKRYYIVCSAKSEDVPWKDASLVGSTESMLDAAEMIMRLFEYQTVQARS